MFMFLMKNEANSVFEDERENVKSHVAELT